MQTITYSKNIFIPLTNICSNRCSYCNFRQPLANAKITTLNEVKQLIKKAKKLGCKEVLFTLGTQPAKVSGFKEKLQAQTDFDSIYQLLIECCRLALAAGLLPHSNVGVVPINILEDLAKYNASMGLMLESITQLPAHRGSPTKNPALRLEFIAQAGQLKIPFTTGLLLGIGEDKKQRYQSLLSLKKLHQQYGHLQEVIIQPIKKKEFTSLTFTELKECVSLARKVMPNEVAIQVPPNLERVSELLTDGVSDLGGISPLTLDYINPNYEWPRLDSLKKEIAPYQLKERLAVYPKFISKEWLAPAVWECLQREGYLNEK
ncbi:7,8-didemethyl-8-hydroxy-5-deazariboflavin synthase subunit CofG [Fuchsiella alkaliacetigena]|uniref:7,8-didemethyl-8-hydroxy-5-deazariboflavin synthase subunit CofG n=1 Tax=Fuchsiella alkaliacetigena TaxID=957042 RepID=UPI00200AA25F|nr:7,8-didemethyl-8-hydroxy-5-deazariboflavin synthase subunit CofG [Fuchsiella alkaliacetigena]MCK8824649.1 7,8-didemethyl-8-hydroxy-5-deazariboflavin synthase subunit CofG [Fuchsiella alkaliacetigena]